ncbi:uncharacterized protein F5891DRAFT_392687 [Suillus fuscotomentosus]|uniref:DUF6533 domain-containing protein n=1 Tax=Suillus fuscotomentosus TaxID=1912939 RepID=A0AAD4HKB7_9AGAM|nr:uncharacterized protein F5891DRAFT_392687 [Suillus fuscotomentosus]KAG1899682.1 hypothetical protein F5891DRAFT_392687 [Suillus fuscotomentosus]
MRVKRAHDVSRSLQSFKYILASLTALWTCDYTCSLHEEWTFLLRSRWSKMKGLYIVTRYLPFIFLATNLYLYVIPNETSGKCRVLENTQSGLGIVLVIVSEIFFSLRTYVLWNRNRILLVAILFTSFVSSQFTHNTEASGKCIGQTFPAASFSIFFAAGVPTACIRSHLPFGVPRPLKHSVPFHRYD